MSRQAKRCHKCAQIKPLKEFHRHASRKDGRKSACKACTVDINHEYKSRAEVKARMVIYRDKRKPSEAEKQARAKVMEDSRRTYNQSDARKAAVAEQKERERLRAVEYAQTPAFKARDRVKFQKGRESLSDEYIKRQLSKGKFAIPRRVMTVELIELKRAHLELKRMIRRLE